MATPVTVPLLYRAVRSGRLITGLRVAAVTVAALTVAEVAWAATYLAVEEIQPWIWLLPAASGIVAVGVFTRPTAALPAG